MEIVTALLLFLNGNMIEHVYKADLKSCNDSKKIAESVVNTNNVVFICKKVKAKVVIDNDTQSNITLIYLCHLLTFHHQLVSGLFHLRYPSIVQYISKWYQLQLCS